MFRAKLTLLSALLFSTQLWAGEYITDIPSQSAINLDSEAGRSELASLLFEQKQSGQSEPILLEYSAQYDVSHLQIHLPALGGIGRVMGRIPLVGGIFNRIFREFDPPKTITLRAVLFPAVNATGFMLGVHGLQSNARWYFKSGQALAEKGVTSLFFDRRGSGMSDSITDANGRPMRGHVGSSAFDNLLNAPLDRAVGDPSEFLEDIQVSYEHLYLVRDMQNSAAPIHLYANCFGSRVALAYAGEWSNPEEGIASIIMTSPGTNMKKGELNSAQRIGALGPIEAYKDINLVDEDFTSNPVALSEMADDDLSLILRKVTNRFLLSAGGLTKKMKTVFKHKRLENVPALVVIPAQDKIIYTQETQQTFADNYPGPTLVSWLDTEHMIEFDDQARADFVNIVSQWIYNQDAGWAGFKGPANFSRQLQNQKQNGALPTMQADKLASYRD